MELLSECFRILVFLLNVMWHSDTACMSTFKLATLSWINHGIHFDAIGLFFLTWQIFSIHCVPPKTETFIIMHEAIYVNGKSKLEQMYCTKCLHVHENIHIWWATLEYRAFEVYSDKLSLCTQNCAVYQHQIMCASSCYEDRCTIAWWYWPSKQFTALPCSFCGFLSQILKWNILLC